MKARGIRLFHNKRRVRNWSKLQWQSASPVYEDGTGVGHIYGMSFYTNVKLGTRAAQAEHKRRKGW